MTNISKTILITVPHAKCVSTGSNHSCDTIALSRGKALEMSMQNRGINIQLCAANTNRLVMDENRDESWNDEYRINIRNIMNEQNVAMLVDVHSYPNEGSFKGYDMYILYLEELISSGYAYGLNKFLDEKGYRVGRTRGSRVNSIMREATEMNIPSILIEFNEGMDEAREEKLVQDIANWMGSVFY